MIQITCEQKITHRFYYYGGRIMINMNKLHNMSYEEGKVYLERNEYVQSGSASSTDTTISDRVEDIYFTLYDEDD